MCAITRGRSYAYEEGGDDRITQLIPVERRERVQPRTGPATGDRSELNIVGGNPGNPAEVRHRLDDVSGEPIVDEHGCETIHEPSHSGDRPAVDHFIGLGVEGTVKGNDPQVGRPDSIGWVDEEPTSYASETVAHEVCGEGHED